MFMINEIVVDNQTDDRYTSKSIAIIVHISGKKGKNIYKTLKMRGRRNNIMAKRNTSDEKLEMSFLSGWS